MLTDKEYKPMKKREILELMRLKNWPRTKLAAELHLADNTVQKWISAGEAPDGPAVVLMDIWLREARGELRIVEVEPAAASA